MSRVEHSLAAVKHFVVLVLPSFGLSPLDFSLAKSKSYSSTDLFKIIHVSSQKVAVEFLEDFCCFSLEIVEIKIGIIGLHSFNSPSTRRLVINYV